LQKEEREKKYEVLEARERGRGVYSQGFFKRLRVKLEGSRERRR